MKGEKVEGVRWAKGVSLAFAYAEDLGPAIGTNARDRSLSVLERDVLGVLDLHAGLALHTVCLWHMRFIWASPSKLVVFSTHVAPRNTRSGLRKNDCDMSRQWEFAPIEVASLKVLVISDTQVSTIAQRLPEKILKKGGSSDMTIHAGAQEHARTALIHFATSYCEPRVWASLPASRVMNVGRWKIGIAHGHEGRGLDRPMRSLSISSKGSVECGRRL